MATAHAFQLSKWPLMVVIVNINGRRIFDIGISVVQEEIVP